MPYNRKYKHIRKGQNRPKLNQKEKNKERNIDSNFFQKLEIKQLDEKNLEDELMSLSEDERSNVDNGSFGHDDYNSTIEPNMILSKINEKPDEESIESICHESDHDSNLNDLALLSLFLSGNITQSTFRILCDYLKIIDTSYQIPNNLNHCINRVIKTDHLEYIKWFFCQKCDTNYSSENVSNQFTNRCGICNNKLQIDYQLSISQQIKRIINIRNLVDTFPETSTDSHKIYDIYDGKIYQKVLENEDYKKYKILTLLFNSDGIQICNKSDLSIWPLIFVINELPIEQRFSFQNIIIAGSSHD